MSLDEAKAVEFLEDAVKKTLKKPVLKVARIGKALSEEVTEDISVGGDKGSRANYYYPPKSCLKRLLPTLKSL